MPEEEWIKQKSNDAPTDNQPVVNMILQRAQRQTSFNSASIEASKGIFGPTVYIDAKLNGKVEATTI